MNNDQNSWLMIMVVAFMGGIVSNIVKPKRRGLIGFAAAGIISVFCGGVTGLCSSAFGITTEGQIFIAAIIGISSDRVLTLWLCQDEKTTNNYIQHNSGNSQGNQVADNDGKVGK